MSHDISHTHKWGMSHAWMRHVTHMTACSVSPCVIGACGMTHTCATHACDITLYVSHTWTMCHTYECVTSHTWQQCSVSPHMCDTCMWHDSHMCYTCMWYDSTTWLYMCHTHVNYACDTCSCRSVAFFFFRLSRPRPPQHKFSFNQKKMFYICSTCVSEDSFKTI